MKKIFTLIALAAVAMGVNAQTESYYAIDNKALNADFKGCVDDGTFTFTKKTSAHVTLEAKASKTPVNSTNSSDYLKTQAEWTSWSDANWSVKNRNDIDFWWAEGTGINYVSFVAYRAYQQGDPIDEWGPANNDNREDIKNGYTYYSPDGSSDLPTNGEYIALTTDVDGMFKIGCWINKNADRKMYITKKSDKKALTWDADVTKTEYKIAGFANGFNEYTDETKTATKLQFVPSFPVEDYCIAANLTNTKILDADNNPTVVSIQGQPKFVWFLFDAKKDETYYIMGSDWQFGFSSYEFTPGETQKEHDIPDPTGIEAITTKDVKDNTNSAIYNLAGQKVDKSFKGIVIQNGKKFFSK